MISRGRTLSELHWRNRVARTRKAQQSKKSARQTEQTKKGLAGVPCKQANAYRHRDQSQRGERQRLEWHDETAKLSPHARAVARS